MNRRPAKPKRAVTPPTIELWSREQNQERPRPNPLAMPRLNKMTVSTPVRRYLACPNKGCTMKFLAKKDYVTHLKRCGFGSAPCEFCNKEVQAKDLAEHMDVGCEGLSLPCPFCMKNIIKRDFDSHREACIQHSMSGRKIKQLENEINNFNDLRLDLESGDALPYEKNKDLLGLEFDDVISDDDDDDEFRKKMKGSLEEYQQKITELNKILDSKFKDINITLKDEERENALALLSEQLDKDLDISALTDSIKDLGELSFEDLSHDYGYKPPECKTVPNIAPDGTIFWWEIDEFSRKRDELNTLEGDFYETENEEYVFRPELVFNNGGLDVGIWIHRVKENIPWPANLRIRLANASSSEEFLAEVSFQDGERTEGLSAIDQNSNFYYVENFVPLESLEDDQKELLVGNLLKLKFEFD